MKIESQFFKDIRRLDRSAFNLTIGLGAAAFSIAPIILGFAIQQPALLFASLGAVFLTFTAPRFLPTIPSRMLILVCCTEAAAFGVGTLTATTGHLLSPILLGIGVFVSLFAWARTKWAAIGMFTAIIFAVGVGLPGYSIQSAGLRTFYSLIGTLWALLGIQIHRIVISNRIQVSEPRNAAAAGEKQPMPRLEALRSALIIGIASALGYTIGLELGLPRDFWIIIPIIFAVRPNPNLTITFTSMMVIGTIAGAMIAAVITLGTSNIYLLLALLFSFAVVAIAIIGVNLILSQIFLVPFIIILLNIYNPGEWYLSLVRIVDVAIGGAIAIATVYLKGLKYFSRIHS